ncbi:hypothetical protein PENSPDRAFT_646089 [Peniophora sp. CONT]|nr:hypothetical protein PENSPDRAFT_646089 [Peniophora sp. CONT]
MLSLQSLPIKVKNADVTFTYLDSGIPPDSEEPYTTIIAVHSLAYTAHVESR